MGYYTIAENYGGIELGAIDLIPVMEELGRAIMPDVYADIGICSATIS